MKTIILAFVSLFSLTLFSQATISGRIINQKGVPVVGANVYIEGSYDGASSAENGIFSFTTTTTGNQNLVVSFLIYETSNTMIDVAHFQNQTIKLKDNVNALDAVVITAGSLDSGSKARVSVLKPLDIVTTAGSAGNIVAALQTLPGTQKVGDDGRLFVRGGEANETQTYVDGIRVPQPYGASPNNLPTRSRFSPFLFSGISFSTGGYSAEYGEALSSVLLLNTIDEPDQSKTDISLMTVGVGLGNTQKWNKSSFSINTSYINLSPYQALVPQDVEWKSAPQSLSGEMVYRYNFEKGIFKIYAAFDATQFVIKQDNINSIDKITVDSKNDNLYFNSSYVGGFGENWNITAGLSYGYNQGKTGIDLDKLENAEKAANMKLKLTKNVSNRFKLSFGTDYFITKYDENFTRNAGNTFDYGYDNTIGALYTEADIFFSKKLAAKVGVRASTNSLTNDNFVSPRISFAYKMAKSSQLSFAYGDFSQTPSVEYIKFSKNNQFESEKASHFILNYQYHREGQTFRAEAYYKDYSNLVRFDSPTIAYNSVFTNDGKGYAKGLDLFWRDGKTIKNLEYWISYSYIDTERLYKNYPTQVTPNFVPNNSLSIVTKYWIMDWKSQIGFTNSFSTGRPYNNPNETQFMNGKTKSYNDLSFNWAYLLTTQKILYFSVSNVLGANNIHGYNYAVKPDTNGEYRRSAIKPAADRFFFVGFFWTISKNKNDNQLKNL
ncbi:TonB-dependent receptor [Flavobacterium sp. ZT3R18]|uniref:TonB-dependent receptor n=1 Tax=Flavobacterium sp. ZT3R18 TaxID=2594429 RepID=UPI00117AC1D5|nr:TonB-dependent receptor [Flavobacterium sp. ZT3R18]TRX36867.1 TonB-dependent receptor [Flavobacterium sp. ZT3R18]